MQSLYKAVRQVGIGDLFAGELTMIHLDELLGR